MRATHSLAASVAIAYTITWGGIAAYLASRGFRLDLMTTDDVPAVALPMLLGPSLAGVLMVARMEGRRGLSELLARMRRWRAPARMWAVALGTNPTVLVTVLTVLALVVSPSFTPGFQPAFLAVGMVAGGLEELGWTGFATPRLLRFTSPLRAGLVLGLVWATWHAAADLAINGAAMGASWVPYFLVYWMATLIPYRVLMTWVYARTGSVLVAMVMHGSYTGWQGFLNPATTPGQALVWQAAFAIALGLSCAWLVRARGRGQDEALARGRATRVDRSLVA